ncbi:FeoB-associated Cys-rich membrane protein [Myroides marinus]|jgi:hypothetical protein|uniref:Virus attachment protein p12 family protein n=1 Tax=Myroides marinus TaxID=703342 RepID=A0A1H6S7C5_9FLAO|nr:FeoB-associated Cys-rich membrane protein [Myroides marinus]MDR0195835.1 FeoB-associated Cys-rich membrane protein [Myroides sp.]MDM1347201.1 FeoB-associated Cys-rich membrane protein [Myroides marinus]MDM1350497.1 FeoB-associated Cys-rich membrane protein [Myroides marinus]MDM1355038.1 FeoB-associated Cys-rich membrane protein [Myroides marinus]MDM1357768.1 FeoB-associated Cys-rich membrane protein [Myroides marinus]
MGYQEIIAYAIVIIALGYIIKKGFWKGNNKKKGSCGGGSCGCS